MGIAASNEIDDAMRAVVEQRLGRTPRGLRDVPIYDADGLPAVIRVASIVDGKPFPTLFWLIDPVLNLRIDRDEARGCIARFQARINSDVALRASMVEDHRKHIALRDAYLTGDERAALDQRGHADALTRRGIGGIADFTRVRCLHTWYAAHLVEANTVGAMLDAQWGDEGA